MEDGRRKECVACGVSHTGACVEKGHTHDLMLCGCHIEMLDYFSLGVGVGHIFILYWVSQIM